MKTKSFIVVMLLVATMPVRAATNDLTSALQKGLFEEEANHNLDAAAQAYQAVSMQFDKDRKLAATAIFRLGEVYRKQGKTNEATAQYERIVREFSDQPTLVTLSRQNLAVLGAKRSATNTAEPVQVASTPPTPEAEELARTEKILLQLKDWDLPQLRRLIPTLVPDSEFERLETELASIEVRGNAVPEVLLKRRDEVKTVMAERAAVILEMLHRRAESLREVVSKQLAARKVGSSFSDSKTSPPPTDDEEKEIRRIQEMIRNSPDLVNAPGGGGGFTPLGAAARLGQLRVAKFLLDAGAKVDLPSAGSSPIHDAAAAGHKAMVELLLERQADVNARGSSGRTPLHAAAENGFQSVVEALLARKADVNAQAKKQETPLSLAAAKGHSAMVDLLIARGAKTEMKAEKGWTPLMWAAFEGHPDVVKRLLEAKADANVEDTFGRTALSYAAERGQLDMAKALLEANADPDAGKMNLPLHVAIRGKNLQIGEALLNAKADPNRAARVNWAVRGETPGAVLAAPLYVAVNQSSSDAVKLLLKYKADPNREVPNSRPVIIYTLSQPEMLKALLEAGADANVDSWEGTPLLVAAAVESHADAVGLLLSHGAKPDKPGSDGRTAINYAAERGCLKCVEPLLEAKADPNSATREGVTALHWAVNHGLKEMVEALIAHGADVNRKAEGGSTPLHWAVGIGGNGIGAQKMAELLLSKGADPNLRRNDGLTPLDLAKGKTGPPTVSMRSLPRFIPIPGQQPESESRRTEITTVLREHGALDDLPDFNSIRVTRVGLAQPMVVFVKDTNSVNRFTLLEVVRNYYPGGPVPPTSLPFPDFSKMIIHRPVAGKPGAQKEITVNLLTVTNTFDCAKDTCLEFGDVVEIPEREHTLAEQGIGLTAAQNQQLGQCLEGKVTFVVRGQKALVKLDGYAGTGLLQSALGSVRNLLRSSSDLSHIRIKRTDPASGKTSEIITDSKAPPPNNLWLRDGDVIEVPDKP